ncbi:hypothetical protein BaRGS_00007924 [Batillaria attramentaria]|uniref:Secreted protein n=1 Tax=Batillaria attramentaria TaxID=370345 RepID=A0ABD0JGS1_9CAEN
MGHTCIIRARWVPHIGVTTAGMCRLSFLLACKQKSIHSEFSVLELKVLFASSAALSLACSSHQFPGRGEAHSWTLNALLVFNDPSVVRSTNTSCPSFHSAAGGTEPGKPVRSICRQRKRFTYH